MASLDMWGMLVRLLLAAGLGTAIGLEREYRQKPAGLRTNILIAMGSALFTTISLSMAAAGGQADRIAPNIITGIGFIGGGAILRSDTSVHGMTTAATIWVNAAIGMAVGMGDYVLASVATAVTLVVLGVLPPIEGAFERHAGFVNHMHEQKRGAARRRRRDDPAPAPTDRVES